MFGVDILVFGGSTAKPCFLRLVFFVRGCAEDRFSARSGGGDERVSSKDRDALRAVRDCIQDRAECAERAKITVKSCMLFSLSGIWVPDCCDIMRSNDREESG